MGIEKEASDDPDLAETMSVLHMMKTCIEYQYYYVSYDMTERKI